MQQWLLDIVWKNTYVSSLQRPHVFIHGHTFALIEVCLHTLLVESNDLLFLSDVFLFISIIQSLETLQVMTIVLVYFLFL